MIKNLFLFRFFQKKHIIFCLLIFGIILATIFYIQLSKAKNDKVLHINTDRSVAIKQMMEKSNAFWYSGKNDSALFYFNRTQLLCYPKADYADYYVGSLNNMVEILQQNGNYNEAETTLIKAFPYLEKTTNVKYAVNAYTFMAYNYLYMYDYEKALYYHRKALKKAISTFRKARILSEIAFAYMHQKKYQEAVNLLEPISKCKIADKITPSNTNAQRAAILYNLGLSYLRLGDHKDEALKCFNESLELTLKLNDDYELIGNYYAFYLFYSKYHNPVLKKINAEKAYYCAKSAKSVTNEINMLASLIEADNAENSKKHWKVYSKKIDSLIVSRKKAKNQFANIIYDSKKDKEENLELKTQKLENELELQRQKNRSFISYIIISFSIFILLFLIFYITSKGKREKKDIIYKSEMRISNKLHDELAINVHQTLLFAEDNDLENEENKEKLLYHLNNIYSKTRNISKENSQIPTDDRYVAILKEMISEYRSKDVNIILNGFDVVFWNTIEKNRKIILYRILQELLFNMKKHSDATLISIILKINNKSLTVVCTDNSTEITTKDTILEKRLQNVENRIKTIKGTINFDKNTERGFKISFTFPI